MTHILASVKNVKEAQAVANTGVGIIDLKDPSKGALGALSYERINEIVTYINHKKTTSSTIGDLPNNAELIYQHINKIAKTGVDFIKIGIFSNEYITSLDLLSSIAKKDVKLVGVLFADKPLDYMMWLKSLSNAGFSGVMLDTSDKSNGSLCSHINMDSLEKFIHEARKNSLLSGVAGSLTKQSALKIKKLNPDYMGFRTALCSKNMRNNEIDINKVNELVEICRAAKTLNQSIEQNRKHSHLAI
jgi:uncharacterized protein (UPF0264 family)